MATSNEILNKLVAEPDSLKAERIGEEFLVNDVRGSTLPNTGNLATFLLLQNFYKNAAPTADDKAKNERHLKNIQNAVDQENKYLLEAVDILSGDNTLDDSATDEDKKKFLSRMNLRSKYGSTIDGAAVLSNLLRRKANEREFDEMIDPLVQNILDDRNRWRNTPWGGSASSSSSSSSKTGTRDG